jgi:hypothetical protein
MYRMLNIVDEFTRGCLVIKDARGLNSVDVIKTLAVCSCCAVRQHTSVPTRARNSLRKP